MDPQQLETLNTFLSQVARDNLFQYLGLRLEATDDEARAAIKKRRSWAQGQQSNPKYRSEAIWVIKNISLIKQILLEERTTYVQQLRLEKHRSALRTLSVYILGAMAGGVLSNLAEKAIRERGVKLGLPETLINQQIERLLKDQNAHREGEGEGTPGDESGIEDSPVDLFDPETDPEEPIKPPPEPVANLDRFVDHYAVLGVEPEASTEQIEGAYRNRYRQAGRLDSPSRARMLYTELDAAWHHLRDPLRRTKYDRLRRHVKQGGDFKSPPPDTDFGDPYTSEAEDFITSEAPRLPDGLAQRTYQPGSGQGRVPKLEIDGPEELRLSVGRSPKKITLTVRNTGNGSMSGRIHADRPWVSSSPARLAPLLKEQVIELTIDPGEMSRQRGQCRVTVSTRTGGNRSVMLQVQRSGRILPYIIGGVTLVGAAVAIVPFIGDAPSTNLSGQGRLIVKIDPPVGEVYINDALINTQGALDTEAGFPLDTPFTVKIQADGFKEWFKTTTVASGKTVLLDAELELTDPMNFAPKNEWEEGGLNTGALQGEINEHSASFEHCFAGSNLGAPGYTAILDVQGYINQLGAVARVDFLDRNFDAPELDHCLRRQFRGLSLPLLNPRFDYATFTHTFHYTVPGGTPE